MPDVVIENPIINSPFSEPTRPFYFSDGGITGAYFTGAEQPYERLRKALKAEVDEAAWSSLYSTISRPFDNPKTGKIAVKVINHDGDEFLKIYAI